MKKERKYSILVALFVMALTLSALIGSKIIVVLGITFSASALTFPLTFLVTDVISEIWGKRRAKHIVMIGFATLIITVFISSLAVFLPGAQFWEGQDAYQQTLGIVGRIVLGGAIAYLVSQHHDVWAYHMLKEISKGKHLWIRNNLSTMVSQLIDTIVFVTIAFYGVLPTAALVPTILGHWFAKVLFAAADTPFIYLAVRWVRG